MTESAAGDASGKYLHDQKIPVVGWQLGLPVYGTYTNYFGMQNANTKNIQTEFTSRNADVIKALGGKKLAIIGYSTGQQRGLHRAGGVGGQQDQGSEDRLHEPRHPDRHHRVRFGRRPDQAVGCRLRLHRARLRRATPGSSSALKQAGVKLKPIVFPGGYSPLVLGVPAYDDVYFGIEFKPYEITPAWHGLDDFKK